MKITLESCTAVTNAILRKGPFVSHEMYKAHVPQFVSKDGTILFKETTTPLTKEIEEDIETLAAYIALPYQFEGYDITLINQHLLKERAGEFLRYYGTTPDGCWGDVTSNTIIKKILNTSPHILTQHLGVLRSQYTICCKKYASIIKQKPKLIALLTDRASLEQVPELTIERQPSDKIIFIGKQKACVEQDYIAIGLGGKYRHQHNEKFRMTCEVMEGCPF